MVKRLMAILMSALMLVTMLPTNSVTAYAANAEECNHILTEEDIANIPEKFWETHDYDEYKVGSPAFISVEVPAGCTEDGWYIEKTDTTGFCIACGEVITEGDKQPLYATGHAYETTKEPTCTEAGLKECQNTNYKLVVEEVNGIYSASLKKVDCDAKEVSIPAIGHSWSEKVETVEPTCTEDGSKTTIKTCDYCGKVEEQTITIDKLGHDYEKEVIQEATCDNEGTYLYTCTRCGDTYTETVPKLIHKGLITTQEPTCIDYGKREGVCELCGRYIVEAIEPLGHDFETKVTAPTCTEDGYTTFTCKRCGYEYKGEYVLATGHDYPETPDSVKEPTCTEKGIETYICKNNSEHIVTKEIPALGHKMTITEHVDATCTESGRNVYTCERCGNAYVERIPALGHDVEIIETIEPNCVHGTIDIGICNRCDKAIVTEADDVDYSVSFAGGLGMAGANGFYVEPVAGEEDTYYLRSYFPMADVVINFAAVLANPDLFMQFITATGHNYYNYDDNAPYATEYVPATCDTDAYWTITCCREEEVPVAGTYDSVDDIVTETRTCPYPDSETAQGHVIKIINANSAYGHSWKLLDDENSKAPTCGEDGYRKYICLNDHAHTYTETIPATGEHKYTTEHVAATCTTPGKDVYTCSVCGDKYEVTTTPAKGHNYTVSATVAATCATEGYDVYTCTECGDTYNQVTTSAKGHQFTETGYKAPTCEEQGVRTYTCVNCENTYNSYEPALGHNYGKANVIKPTCTAEGYTLYTCTNPGCTYSYKTEITDKVDHVLSVVDQKAPTCAEDGYEKRACANCAYTETKVLPATGNHVYDNAVTKAATCTENGVMTYTCQGCGKEYTEVIPAIGHNYGNVKVVEATCTTEGYTEYTCTNPGCTDSYKTETTDKVDHVLSVVDQKNATCTEKGYVTRACANCEYKETEEIAATGHIFDDEGVNTPATCEKEGYTTYTCAVCGEKQVVKTAEKIGHVYKSEVSIPAKLNKDGIETEVCIHCGKKIVVNTIDAIKSVTLSSNSFVYNKKAIRPKVTIKDTKGNVISPKYYTITYANNKKVGTATVTVKFKGLYAGTVVKKFSINPRRVGTAKFSTSNKSITFTWGKVKVCDGYKIQYSTSNTFKKVKTITVKGRNNYQYTFNNLKSGKKYYIRIRAYKKVGGKTYYGSWTKKGVVCK